MKVSAKHAKRRERERPAKAGTPYQEVDGDAALVTDICNRLAAGRALVAWRERYARRLAAQ